MMVLVATFALLLGASPSGPNDGSPQRAAGRRLVLRVDPGTARPGDLIMVTHYTEHRQKPPSGTLGGKPLAFFGFERGFRALAPLSVDLPAAPIEVTVTPRDPEEPEPLRSTVELQDPAFRESVLTVARKFVSPPRSVKAQIKQDKAAFARAYDQPFGAPLFARNFIWPREALITAPFGDRRVFNGKLQSQHYGIDLDGRTGDPIFAANDGVVVMARDCYASGRTVLLHHGAGIFTAYFHLSKIEVKVGDRLAQGQKLGLLGKTGRVTGPHLHWAVKVHGLYVNPASLLALDFEG